MTYIVIILRFLVLHKQLQPFLPNEGLNMSTTAMTFLRLVGVLSIFLRLIWLANHFTLTVRPNCAHLLLWIP